MTDQQLFEAFLEQTGWGIKKMQSSGVTELPMGSREDIFYVDHDTMICFRYVDLFFRKGKLVATIRCDGRRDEHEAQIIGEIHWKEAQQ